MARTINHRTIGNHTRTLRQTRRGSAQATVIFRMTHGGFPSCAIAEHFLIAGRGNSGLVLLVIRIGHSVEALNWNIQRCILEIRHTKVRRIVGIQIVIRQIPFIVRTCADG